MARITQQELARRLGVSRSTVALALNPAYAMRLSPSVRQKVTDAAKKWNYRPDRYASVMRGGKSGLIGIFHFGGLMQVAAERVFHAARVIRSAGYEVMSFDASWAAESVSVAVRSMIDARVEGVIVAGLNDDSIAKSFAAFPQAGIPVVALSGNPLMFAPHFRGDASLAYDELARHLMGLGHRRLALMTHHGGLSDKAGGYVWAGRERIKGFRAALTKMGGGLVKKFSAAEPRIPQGILTSIELPEDVFDPFARGAMGMAEILKADIRPTAILCEDDEVAIGALHAARSAGLDVPGDIAVTGYDDTATGRYCEVPLTTVRQPNQVMAEKCVEVLLGMVASQSPGNRARKQLFTGEMIIRESCGSSKTAATRTTGR